MRQEGFKSGPGRWPAILAILTAAAAVLAAAGCSDDSENPAGPSGGNECGEILAVTTDYATGSLAVVSGDSTADVAKDVAAVHADAVARVHDGLVWIVNRLGADNIQVLDPAAGFSTIRQFSTGAGTNPRDIAFGEAADRAYVSRALSASLLEIDPRSGAHVREIALDVYADADRIPDMDRLLYVAPRIYVALQRIDFGGGTYLPVAPSMIAVYDTEADSLVDFDPALAGSQAILLQGLNPTAPMIWNARRGEILVPESGVYGVNDAGIERVDPVAGRSLGWMLREEALGGDLIDFVLSEANGGTVGIEGSERGFATASFPTATGFGTRLVAFDPSTGAVTDTLYSSDAYDLADLVLSRCGILFVCDRAYGSSGLRAFRAEDGSPLSIGTGAGGTISTGLPPFELVRLDDE